MSSHSLHLDSQFAQLSLEAAPTKSPPANQSAISHCPPRHPAATYPQRLQLITMFRLDYLSCCLTILSTVLLGRKLWIGLVIAAINSVIVCVIGIRTSQFGFIPANLFCIVIYAFSIRSWLRDQTLARKPANPGDGFSAEISQNR
jgi:hypothetical protein